MVCEKFEFGIFHCPCSLLGVSDGRAISDEYRTQTVRFRSYWLPVLLTLLNWSLQQGLHIVDYNLHTTRYLLKETRIPAFQGNVTIEARLAPPLLELWNALLSFASHGGVGIKTTLGMGGAATDFYKKMPVI